MADAEAVADASVLEAAVQRGFSTDGEVFDVPTSPRSPRRCVGSMRGCSTLRRWHQKRARQREVSASCARCSTRRSIACWLRLGGMAIVPYDKGDANHGPVERGGRAAHYALLVAAGVCRQERREVPPAAGTVGPLKALGCSLACTGSHGSLW